jgi:hypothetical protein
MTRLVLALLLIPTIAAAAPTSFKCTFPEYFNPEEGRGTPKDGWPMEFLLDGDTGKAYFIGVLGSVEVSLVAKTGQVTFIEQTDTGNIFTTTVTGKGDAVHSRNTVILGDLVPSQYYGSCTVQ